jgi:hypothetical protein
MGFYGFLDHEQAWLKRHVSSRQEEWAMNTMTSSLKRWLVVACGLALVSTTVVGVAFAEDQNLLCSRVQKSVVLSGSDSLNLSGSNNQLNVTGQGQGIQVVGSNNSITLDGEVGLVQVVGSNNTLRWIKRGTRKKPGWQSMGSNNVFEEVNQ